MGAFFREQNYKNRGVILKLSRDEVFNRLTENGKYIGLCKNEYNGMYLGLGCYIASVTLKAKHPRPEKTFYDHGEKYDVKS